MNVQTKIAIVISAFVCFIAQGDKLHAAACYESTIVKPTPFMGNDGEIIKLSDGTLWEIKYEYEYMYEYNPEVIVCPSRGKIIVDGKSLTVEQLK